jgi:hypothetical protein
MRSTQYTGNRSLLHRQRGPSLLARSIERAFWVVSDKSCLMGEGSNLPNFPNFPGIRMQAGCVPCSGPGVTPVEARARANFLNFLNFRGTSESTPRLTD